MSKNEEQTKENFLQSKKFKVLQGLIIAIGVIVLVIAEFAIQNGDLAYRNKVNALNDEIERLEAEQKNISDDTSQESVATATQASLHSAQELGQQVADAQNQMRVLEPETQEEEIVKLAMYVGERFDEESQRFRVSWLGGVTGNITWQFCTPYEFVGDELGVAWLGYDENGTLVGYARATYSVADNIFKNVNVQKTEAGKSQMGYTPDFLATENTEEAGE